MNKVLFVLKYININIKFDSVYLNKKSSHDWLKNFWGLTRNVFMSIKQIW